MTPGPSRSATLLRALLLGALLAVSGAAALAHEAAWPRLFTPVVGAGPATLAAVVAGALAGLALGAAAGGPWADRVARPGRLLAVAEALGAAIAFALPRAVDAFGPALAAAPEAVRLLGVVVACGAAMAPLGVSLPAAVRCVDPAGDRAARILGRLYAVNTVGAVLGVAWPTAFGFEAVGTRAVITAAAVAQACVALVAAVALGGRRGPAADAPAAPAPVGAPPGPAGVPVALKVAAALAGAAGLPVQVAWVRRLTPALGTTSYAFGTVLCAYLLAIAVGTALFGPRAPRPAGARPAWVLAASAVPVVALVPLLLPVARWAGEVLGDALAAGPVDPRTLLGIRAVATIALLGPAAAISAAALPWLVHAAAPARDRAGAASGVVYAWNAAGSAVAALVAGLVAIPAFGTAGTLRAAAGLLVAAAACVTAGRARTGLACGAVLLVVSAALPVPDAAGRDAVGATFDPLWTDPADAPALRFEEGRASTVVVRARDGRTELWVDGKIVASASPTDRMHLGLLGHLPMLFHPAPRRAAVVGLGTGITATAVAAHAPERLDVFELEAAVVRGAEFFRDVGGGLPPGATLHVVDGRHGLDAADAPYDVITSDPIHPAAAGSAELYTDEHYAALERRLAPGGIVCQWLPLYELEIDDVAMVLRTLARRFDVAVFVAGPDLVILAARPGGLRVDERGMAERLAGRVGDDLRALGLATPGRLLGLLAAGPRRVRVLAGDGPVNTDDRPLLEFASARSQYTGSASRNLLWVAGVGDDPAALLTSPPADAAAFAAGVERTRKQRRAFARWLPAGIDAWAGALPLFEDLAAGDPTDRLSAWMRDECASLWALDGARGDDPEGAAARAREVLARPDAEVRARITAAQALADAGFPAEARAAARAVLAVEPRSARARRLAQGP